MRFKQKVRTDAISALDRLIGGNVSSMDERASTLQSELHRWRKSKQKNPLTKVDIGDRLEKWAGEIAYLENQNTGIAMLKAQLEGILEDDLKDDTKTEKSGPKI